MLSEPSQFVFLWVVCEVTIELKAVCVFVCVFLPQMRPIVGAGRDS